MIDVKTFTWIILPKGKRKKKVLPLDKRLEPYPKLFADKFGEPPKIVIMRKEMAEDWEEDTVLGLRIIRVNNNYPTHAYSFAVEEDDFYGGRSEWRSDVTQG